MDNTIDITRKGFFKINHSLLLQMDKELRSKVFGDLVIIEATNSLFDDTITYKALCETFKQIKEGDKIPIYWLEVKSIKDGLESYRFINEVDIYKGGGGLSHDTKELDKAGGD